MLEARKVNFWGSRYQILADDQPVAVWDGQVWRNGGTIYLAGRRYDLTSNVWGMRYEMTDEMGMIIARADRVGRKQWTIEGNGRTYQFQRASLWRSEQLLVVDGRATGSVRRASLLGGAVADLPALPLPLQVFVLIVVLAMWNAQTSASTAALGGTSGGA